MKARAVLYLLGLTLLAFTGSDIFKAEILTGFEISPEQAYPSRNNTITMKNTGHLQADNVIILLAANKNITDFSNMCAESQIDYFDNSTLIVKLSRMSPYMPCKVELEASGPASLNYTITADGRLGPWNSLSPLVFLILVGAIPVLIVVVEVCLLHAVLKNKLSRVLYWLDMQFRKNDWCKQHLLGIKADENKKLDKNIVSMKAEETISFVKSEYGIKLDAVDATILKLIHAKKATVRQLKNTMGFSRWHIMSRLNELREYELLSEDRKKVDNALEDYFNMRDKPNDDVSTAGGFHEEKSTK